MGFIIGKKITDVFQKITSFFKNKILIVYSPEKNLSRRHFFMQKPLQSGGFFSIIKMVFYKLQFLE